MDCVKLLTFSVVWLLLRTKNMKLYNLQFVQFTIKQSLISLNFVAFNKKIMVADL